MEHYSYLQSLLGRTLCVHTTDKRMFVGTFKCTDMECNVILSTTYEYRFPSQAAVQAAAENAASSTQQQQEQQQQQQQQQAGSNFKVDMTSRLIGLVVVPGKHITKIELEENPHEVRMQPTTTVV